MIQEAGLTGCKPSIIPINPKYKLALSTTPILTDPTPYRRLIGKLIYLTVTRPKISYAVHVRSQFMNTPTEEHLQAGHKILRYLKNAPAQGLYYPASQTLTLTAYCDADWGSCPITRRVCNCYAILLGKSLVSWKTKKQTVVSCSSAKAEYCAMTQTCKEITWLNRLLQDLLLPPQDSIPLFCDNQAALHISKNLVFHERTKHDEIDCHLVR